MRSELLLRRLKVGGKQPAHAPELQRAALLVRLAVVGDAHGHEVFVGAPLRVHDVPDVPDVLHHELRRQPVRGRRGAGGVKHRHAPVVAGRQQPRLHGGGGSSCSGSAADNPATRMHAQGHAAVHVCRRRPLERCASSGPRGVGFRDVNKVRTLSATQRRAGAASIVP